MSLAKDEVVEILRQIRAYSRAQAAISLRETASRVIDGKEKAQAYQELDGTNSHEKISRSIAVPRKTVTNWVGEFIRSGLAVDALGFK